jgi:uncharacterized hydantoinase/oxoprolinase family protein
MVDVLPCIGGSVLLVDMGALLREVVPQADNRANRASAALVRWKLSVYFMAGAPFEPLKTALDAVVVQALPRGPVSRQASLA